MVNRSRANRPANEGSLASLDATRNGLDLDETSTHPIDADFEYATPDSPVHNETLEWDIQDLLPGGFHKDLESRKIKIKGVIQFVLARRPRGQEAGWEFFDKEILMDMMIKIQMNLVDEGSTASKAFEYANLWGGVPVIGLNASCINHLIAFRKEIEEFSNEFEYHTFPRAALLSKVAVTALLSRDHAGIDVKYVGRLLMDMNSEVLCGGVRPIKQKYFHSTDIDRQGNSLAGYRLVQLDGTSEFMDSLSKLPWNYRFKLGTGTITIRSAGRVPPRRPQSLGFGGGRGRGRGQRNRLPGPLRSTGRGAARGGYAQAAAATRYPALEHEEDPLHVGDQERIQSASFTANAQKSLLNMSSSQAFQQIGDGMRGGTGRGHRASGQEGDNPPGASGI
jgi:hypothetical protein